MVDSSFAAGRCRVRVATAHHHALHLHEANKYDRASQQKCRELQSEMKNKILSDRQFVQAGAQGAERKEQMPAWTRQDWLRSPFAVNGRA
jgi:hypothetical protein